jgi:hypothetical protein
MEAVYLLHHITIHHENDEDLKLIGVFSSRELAKEAILQLSEKPGFKGRSELQVEYGDESGFYISEYHLNQLEWQEGFISPYHHPRNSSTELHS